MPEPPRSLAVATTGAKPALIDAAREGTAEAAGQRASSYRPDIDGLRAVAILVVLGFHAFPDVVSGGYVGVDVFFVISGFLITGIICGPLQAGRFSFRGFYARRIRRLYPALLTVLAATLLIGWFALSPPNLESLGKYTLGGAAFVPNIVFWQEAGYFDRAALTKPLLHLWSLGIEEQFYLAWPVTLYVFSKLRVPLTAVLWVVAIASFVACAVLTRDHRTAAFYLPFTRAWELALGGLLARDAISGGVKQLEEATSRYRDLLSLVGAALIAVAVVLFTDQAQFPGFAALFPTLGTAALIGSGRRALVNRILALRPLVFVGLVSYPLYLWHWPLLSFAFIDAKGMPPVAHRLEILAASFVLAVVTYRFVERPFRGSRGRGWHVSVLVAAMVTLGVTGWVIYQQEGFKSRYPISIQSVLDYKNYSAGKDARAGVCWVSTQVKFEDYDRTCFLSPEDAQKDGILIWGDSYAGRLYVGLRSALGPGAHIAQFNRDSCPPLIGGGCQEGNDGVMRAIEQMKPRTVILFANWNVATRGEDWVQGKEPYARLQQTIDRLEAAGVVKIILVGPAQLWKAFLPQLLFEDWQAQREPKVIPERLSGNLDPDTPALDRALRAIATSRRIIYVSPIDLLCNEKGCLTYVPDEPGKLITWDIGHLTSEGATYFVRLLIQNGTLGN